MEKGTLTEKLDAFALFPDLMRESKGVVRLKKRKTAAKTSIEVKDKAQPIPRKSGVLPPPPPDLSWLKDGNYEDLDQENISDIRTALVLMQDGDAKDSVSLTFKDLGYQVETSEKAPDAIHKLTFTDYAAVVLHANFEEDVTLAESTIHKYVAWLPMGRRRLIYYILVGAKLQTLYNLEALSLSANLVVKDTDIEQLRAILQKSIRDNDELFGPLLESIASVGKR